MKRFLSYFLYSIVMISILVGFLKYQIHLNQQASMTFNSLPSMIYSITFPIVMGVLLGIPELINRVKNRTSSVFNWVMFLAVGIPTLYIVFVPLLYFTKLGDYLPFASIFVQSDLIGASITTMGGVVFGYLLINCFKNKD